MDYFNVLNNFRILFITDKKSLYLRCKQDMEDEEFNKFNSS